eukprot:PhF_6_TR42400/c0_g1_i2/m.63962
MSKPLDYSKWDKIADSDDEDKEKTKKANKKQAEEEVDPYANETSMERERRFLSVKKDYEEAKQKLEYHQEKVRQWDRKEGANNKGGATSAQMKQLRQTVNESVRKALVYTSPCLVLSPMLAVRPFLRQAYTAGFVNFLLFLFYVWILKTVGSLVAPTPWARAVVVSYIVVLVELSIMYAATN